jgi:hypothetical protein
LSLHPLTLLLLSLVSFSPSSSLLPPPSTQTSFRFAGALKLEEIVRALSSVFGRHSSLPVRAHFSRLREVMLVLTADASTISTGAGGQVGGAGAFTENFSQLTASEVEVFLSLRLDVGTH